LTAWTVTRQADGNVDVTIRQLSDPAGSVALVIDPSAIPDGAGLFFLDVPATALNGTPPFPAIDGRSVNIGVVQGSSTCPLH
jgi:hypothetical protein